MFRSAIKLKTISNMSKHNPKQCLRYYSTNGEKSNSAKMGLIVGSSVVVLSGLTIGYAKYDSKFRKSVENSIPYSDQLLNSLLGPMAQNKDLIIPSINDSKDKQIKSFLDKKKERTERLDELNQNKTKTNNTINESKNEEKSEDKSQKLQQNKELKDENQSESTETTEEFYPKEDTNDNNSENSNESSLFDMDLLIAREALKDTLMSVSPTGDDQLKELQKQFNDIELEYQRKISKLEENFESELKTQLKRQLAAFNDHLEDQMSGLRHQLKRNYDNSLEEKLLEEKNRFQSELSNSFYRLQVIEEVIKAKEELDREQQPVRELWVLCQALREALSHRPSLSEECLPISLRQEISAVKTILSKESLSENPIIRSALEGIPKDVVENGVYSEEDLIKRFQKVDKYCKRVALVGDDGGSLYLYLLSYIQSLVVFRTTKIPNEELEDKEVDPSKWDTFDILTRVRHCLNNHNLEMALKYANQLKGEARNVAKDWIRDTRTHLEVRQAVDLLQTEADAINLQIIN